MPVSTAYSIYVTDINGVEVGLPDHVSWRKQLFCKALIHVIFSDSSKGVRPVISLQYLQNVRAKDIWFLVISAISSLCVMRWLAAKMSTIWLLCMRTGYRNPV